MVGHFVSDSHKVMTALILMLPSLLSCQCSCGDFSANLIDIHMVFSPSLIIIALCLLRLICISSLSLIISQFHLHAILLQNELLMSIIKNGGVDAVHVHMVHLVLF